MSAQPPLAVVILAAGEGTRMHSSLPKVMHEAAGRPLLSHVLRAAAPLKAEKTVVVVGFGADAIKAYYASHHEEQALSFVTQDFEAGYGTGHALREAQQALKGFSGSVMVLNGDGPLIKTETLKSLYALGAHQDGMALVTCDVRDPTGLGRIIRQGDGLVARIVEEKDASDAQKQIHEINPGIYLFDAQVFELAQKLSNDNAAGEYLITDMVDLYLQAGKAVHAKRIHDEREILGVNTRKHLADVERILQQRIKERWLLAGVTMINPEQTYIADSVTLARDVILEQGVTLQGVTSVAEGTRIGAYAYLHNCTVDANASVAPHTVLYDTHITKEFTSHKEVIKR